MSVRFIFRGTDVQANGAWRDVWIQLYMFDGCPYCIDRRAKAPWVSLHPQHRALRESLGRRCSIGWSPVPPPLVFTICMMTNQNLRSFGVFWGSRRNISLNDVSKILTLVVHFGIKNLDLHLLEQVVEVLLKFWPEVKY